MERISRPIPYIQTERDFAKINGKVEKQEELLQKTEVKQAEVKENVAEVKKVTKPRAKKK